MPFPAAPITAPTMAELTTHPWTNGDKTHSVLINSIAPEMTPMSKPASKPPSEATTVTRYNQKWRFLPKSENKDMVSSVRTAKPFPYIIL